jgi:hypothetical protein
MKTLKKFQFKQNNLKFKETRFTPRSQTHIFTYCQVIVQLLFDNIEIY